MGFFFLGLFLGCLEYFTDVNKYEKKKRFLNDFRRWWHLVYAKIAGTCLFNGKQQFENFYTSQIKEKHEEINKKRLRSLENKKPNFVVERLKLCNTSVVQRKFSLREYFWKELNLILFTQY